MNFFRKAVNEWLENPTIGRFKDLEKKVHKLWPQHKMELYSIYLANRDLLNLSISTEQ